MTLLPVLLMRSSEMNFSHPGTSNITCVGRAVSSALQQVLPSFPMKICICFRALQSKVGLSMLVVT